MNAPLQLRYSQHQPPAWLLLREEQSWDRATPHPEPSSENAQTPHTAGENDDTPDTPEAAVDWQLVHERLVRLREDRAAHERDLCRWLVAAERLQVHRGAGHASLAEYADRVVGLSARETEERVRVGLAIAELPLLDRALASGDLCWSAVRELTRIATPDTESEWLVWAKGRRTRQIEQAVAGRRHGDSPRKRADPSLVTHVLRFEVRAETIALFRDLQAAVRAALGGEADDDVLLFEIARRALGGPEDEGRASYQVAVTRCDACGQASIEAGGETTPVDPTVAEMVLCDAQQIGSVEHDNTQRAHHSERPHVGAPEQAPRRAPAESSARRTRATQTIPPATRRHVMRRDHKRCVVPGCANHRFLDVHHLDLRSEGGEHDPERMAALCGAHHRAVHQGALSIDNSATGGFVVRHADGTSYGAGVRPAEIELAQQTFTALHDMGFKQSEARERVDAVLRTGAPNDLATFLRAALRSF